MACAIEVFSHEQPYKCAVHIQLSLPQSSAADLMSDSGTCCIYMHSWETGQRILTAYCGVYIQHATTICMTSDDGNTARL